MRRPDFDFTARREEMVRQQLAARDITDAAVRRVMADLPREEFVNPVDWDEAYEDHPLGIECDQTISQPYIVALMTQLLQIRPGVRVLEIGTGSGYQTAVLAALGARVWSVERHRELARTAQRALARCGFSKGVHLRAGDGSIGWPEAAPFDRILLTCCAPQLPPVMLEQLTIDGLLLSPVEQDGDQVLRLTRRTPSGFETHDLLPVRFVPLIGRNGYNLPR